jgi:hypothetical protein
MSRLSIEVIYQAYIVILNLRAMTTFCPRIQACSRYSGTALKLLHQLALDSYALPRLSS